MLFITSEESLHALMKATPHKKGTYIKSEKKKEESEIEKKQRVGAALMRAKIVTEFRYWICGCFSIGTATRGQRKNYQFRKPKNLTWPNGQTSGFQSLWKYYIFLSSAPLSHLRKIIKNASKAGTKKEICFRDDGD